ncbi:MAG: xanthine dehydrogenase accessory protein XdhC [Rhodobacteraceae bacterium]|nr:xanthine dehydrogenase accessory protein XdhC [Paracoccaceae bacterium]TVR48620.1 MAG: xanthine dehydrogenase accessory protein XdhC [Paracoccaceae bacterium]
MIHVQIIRVRGSSPREAGAEMFVGAADIAGTIGGGMVEHQAVQRAHELLVADMARDQMDIALGPALGQCCGGQVRVALTRLDTQTRAAHLVRLDVARLPHVLILGAGHVGRALAEVMAPLPCRVLLIDPRSTELARATAPVETRLTPLPEAEIAAAPPRSAYVVLTHDHGLDFLLTLAALRRGDAAYVGLIGSATKRARFQRFAQETDPAADLSCLTCPIGAGGPRDKHPGVIALATAQEVLGALRDVGRNPTSYTKPTMAMTARI